MQFLNNQLLIYFCLFVTLQNRSKSALTEQEYFSVCVSTINILLMSIFAIKRLISEI